MGAIGLLNTPLRVRDDLGYDYFVPDNNSVGMIRRMHSVWLTNDISREFLYTEPKWSGFSMSGWNDLINPFVNS